MKLNMTICNNLKPKEKPYKKFDGGGLYLEVFPNGSKLWRMKYRYVGKEKRIAFGDFPTVTLSEAREKRREAKLLLNEGRDPIIVRKENQLKLKLETGNGFKSIALEWHKLNVERWSEKYGVKVLRLFENDVFPYLKQTPINKISTFQMLQILRRIEDRKAYYEAGRARQLCSQVFKYGIQTDRCENNPCISLNGALKTRKRVHYPAIEITELPKFLQKLTQNDARLFKSTQNAIWFSLLTFCRPGEIRKARRIDFKLDSDQWIIPAEFMKSDRDHIVPLSHQAKTIIINQIDLIDHLNTEYVFPNMKKPRDPMSDGAVNMAIKRLGYHNKMTAHGFRALARTTIREKLHYDPDVIEAQLAHLPSGPLGRAYDRAQFIGQRTKMMQEWADYIDGLKTRLIISP